MKGVVAPEGRDDLLASAQDGGLFRIGVDGFAGVIAASKQSLVGLGGWCFIDENRVAHRASGHRRLGCDPVFCESPLSKTGCHPT